MVTWTQRYVLPAYSPEPNDPVTQYGDSLSYLCGQVSWQLLMAAGAVILRLVIFKSYQR